LSILRNSEGQIGGGRLYDKHDEVEAFNRGKLFREGNSISNINHLPAAYNNIPDDERNMGNYDWTDPSNPPLTPQRLQQLSNAFRNVLRYDGVTYFPQR